MKNERFKVWINNGYVSPSIRTADGTGTRNIWGEIDLYDVAVFKNIVESGLSRQVANDFIKQGVISGALNPADIQFIAYARQGRQTVSFGFLKSDKVGLKDALSEMDLDPDNIFIFNFAKIKKEVDGMIEKLFGKREKQRKRMEERVKDLSERYPK